MANTLNLGNGNWAAKEGSLLAYNNENGNFKPLPFDFTRASSATRVNSQGLIEVVGSDQPRVDYSSGEGALLLEPARTNLITYSEDFSNASWLKSIATVTLTSEIAPDGTNDSVYSFVGADANLYANTQSTGSEYTISFYVKSNGNGKDVFKLRLGSDFSQVFTATNEWVRYTFNATPSSQVFGISSNDIDSDILIWGAQIELGSYPTSYIPTQGAAVTRVADVCNNAGNDQVFNSTEGVLYLELKALANDGTNRHISINDGTTSNRVNIFYDTSNVLRGFIAGVSSIPTSATITDNNKVAIKYKSGDIALWINGVEVATKTNSISLSGLKSVSFDLIGNLNWYGTCKDMKIYNTALTDEELAALTTI